MKRRRFLGKVEASGRSLRVRLRVFPGMEATCDSVQRFGMWRKTDGQNFEDKNWVLCQSQILEGNRSIFTFLFHGAKNLQIHKSFFIKYLHLVEERFISQCKYQDFEFFCCDTSCVLIAPFNFLLPRFR